MTTDDHLRDQMVELAKRLLRLTLDGKISWDETDKENEFIYSATNNSISISVKNTADMIGRYTLTVLNWRGTMVENLRSGYVKLPNATSFLKEAEWNTVLSDLYAVARKSALQVEKVIGDLLNDLEQDGLAGPSDDATS